MPSPFSNASTSCKSRTHHSIARLCLLVFQQHIGRRILRNLLAAKILLHHCQHARIATAALPLALPIFGMCIGMVTLHPQIPLFLDPFLSYVFHSSKTLYFMYPAMPLASLQKCLPDHISISQSAATLHFVQPLAEIQTATMSSFPESLHYCMTHGVQSVSTRTAPSLYSSLFLQPRVSPLKPHCALVL